MYSFLLFASVISCQQIYGENTDLLVKLNRRVDFLQSALLRLEATVEQQKSEIHQQKELNDIQREEINSLRKICNKHDIPQNVSDRTIRIVETESQVAFFAMKSQGETALADHTILFDTVVVNKGLAYNHYMGTFIAPRAGVYFFSWTIHTGVNTFISTRLMVNGKEMSAIFSDSEEVGDYHSATGVAILDLGIGQAVFIKSHPTHGQKGSILSTDFARCTFSGYLIF